MEIKILEPVELLQNIRRDGGDAICAAKTVDGGVAFVRWDPKKSKWIIDSDLTLGDLLESMPMGEKNLELLNINQKPLLSLEEQYKIINDNYELSKISLDDKKKFIKYFLNGLSQDKLIDVAKKIGLDINQILKK